MKPQLSIIESVQIIRSPKAQAYRHSLSIALPTAKAEAEYQTVSSVTEASKLGSPRLMPA